MAKWRFVPRLNKRQLDKLSDIVSDVALLSLASVVLPAILDKFNPLLIVLGLLTTILLWSVSIKLRR